MQLSSEQTGLGRNSRSRSRSSSSRSESPISGVARGGAVRSLSMSTSEVRAEAYAEIERLALGGDSAPPAEESEDLAPYGGRCFWCLALDPDHVPSKCAQLQRPDMDDFDQRKPRPLRSRAPKKRAASVKARTQTSRPDQEQTAHRAAYKAAHQSRAKAQKDAAKARAIEFARQINEPGRAPRWLWLVWSVHACCCCCCERCARGCTRCHWPRAQASRSALPTRASAPDRIGSGSTRRSLHSGAVPVQWSLGHPA